MAGFWANFGFFTALGILIFGYHKFLDYREMNRPCHQADERVYEAADAFMRGAASQEVAAMLENCLDIGSSQANFIIKTAMSHKEDGDGGYGTFIRSVNREIGENLYSTSNQSKPSGWKANA